MIERNQYIEMLKTNNFDINIFYEYYNEFNKNELFNFSIADFQMLFNNYVGLVGTHNVINTVREYFNNKFNVFYLTDKEGKLLNIF
jgi:hypothetical protein